MNGSTRGTGDIASALEQVRLLRGAPGGFFERLARLPRLRRKARAGETIFEAGDPADAVFVAFAHDVTPGAPRGIVELTLPASDTALQSHVEHIGAAECFGEFEFVAAGLASGKILRRSTARTLAGCDLFRIPYDLLAPLLDEVEAVRTRLIRLAMERLISALNVRSTHLLGDRDIALANWLIDAADNLGVAEGRHVRFSRPIAQKDIAEALGVTRETISLRLNEWERAGLLNTGGQSQRFEILDYPRVALRAGVRKSDPAGAIDAALVEIDADLDRGELVRARNVALDMLTFFPASPDLRHRAALAGMRSGAVREALDILSGGGFATGGNIALLRERIAVGFANPAAAPGRLFMGGSEPFEEASGEEIDAARLATLVEDIAAIEARARKEMAFAARDAGQRAADAEASASRYEAIFTGTGGPYAGVNAAMMALIAGNRARSGAIAHKVLSLLGDGAAGYWAKATLGEASLLLGRSEAALAAFGAAAAEKDTSDGRIASTRLQVRRIAGSLNGDLAAAVLRALPVGRTAVYSGGVAPASEAEFSVAAGAALASAKVRYAYGGLSPGGEILVAEAALAAGVELHLVLPLPVEEYIAAFLDPVEGAERWKERFWACLNRSASLVSLADHAIPVGAHSASRAETLRFAGGLALLRADALTSSAVMIDAGGGGWPLAEWSKAGREVVSLAAETSGARRKTPDRGSDAFGPVIFLWPLDSGADPGELVRIAESAARAKLDAVDRQSRDRRRGIALRAPGVAAALDAVAALAEHCRDARLPARIIADYGLVLDSRGRFSASQVARLSGASDLLGFPAESPLATVAFAAQARFSEARQLAFVPISRLSSGAAEVRPLAAREVYAVAFTDGAAPGYSFSVAAIQS